MFPRGGRPIRDIYELAWAIQRESPEVLAPALDAFHVRGRETMLIMAREMRDGVIPIDDVQPVTDQADRSFADKSRHKNPIHLIWMRLGRARERGLER